jgi:hypothetical protein
MKSVERYARPSSWLSSSVGDEGTVCQAISPGSAHYSACMDSAGGASSLDVHIGHFPPQRWDDLEDRDEHARRVVSGHEVRPTITSEPIAWEPLGLTPRWIGEDSSGAVAAIEPSLLANRGANEWRRFLAGTAKRDELALAISMIGSPDEPEIVQLGGPSASVSLPGAALGFASVGGPRIALAVPPKPAEDLGPADRDLALRLADTRDPALHWWSLHLSGSEVHFGGGSSQIVSPTGSLWPLLVSAAGEVVAAVWTSPDKSVRHYIVPWLPTWTPLLDWLAQRAILEFVPTAARRVRARVGDETELQTADEAAAHAALAQLDEDYRVRRDDLEQSLRDARAAADDLRHDLLFGSGMELEAAVSRVLSDVGFDVTHLDELLGRTASADLLVVQSDRRRLVEVKSASGNASERLVDAAKKHLATWPELRPDIEVEGILLIVNHQATAHPLDRSAEVYSRPEFVRSLTVPVMTTLQLYHAWRQNDFDAIRETVFEDTPKSRSASDGRPIPTPPHPQAGRARRWWRRRQER